MATAFQSLDFASLMPSVAPLLCGQPNKAMSKGSRLRFGNHGSMEIDTAEGWFDDHESNARGGVLELIQHKRGCDKHAALTWLEEQGLKERSARAVQSVPAFYDYHDADGVLAYRVERRGKGFVPPFLQHGPDGRGGFHAAKGCMQGVPRLPYRLPELLGSDQSAVVFVCEGEKDADRLTAAGLVATTNSGGAGKFGSDLAPYFAGRRVAVLADNDEPGRQHAADVAGKLRGIADVVAIIDLPGLPAKGDVSDWLAAGGSPHQLVDQIAEPALTAQAIAAVETFDIADLTIWASTSPTPKAFYMAPFIPRDDVVIITGDGGTNKSTLALQISVCAAARKQMLGMDVTHGPALFITAEDDQRENHWRLAKIATAVGTTIRDIANDLHIVSLRGRLENELATFDHDGKLRPTSAYALLRATIEKTGAKLLTLDNVAHLFAGNENDRSQVTAFINLLYQLCGDFGVTILLIAHRNKAGDSYSGSTAWLNAVRSQVLIERSDENDADVRRMSLGKANYARQGEEVTFRWHDFALIRNDDLPASVGAELAANIQANADNAIFLRCLAERNKQQRHVSEKPNASNYAPKMFEPMPEAKGLKRKRLEAAMDRLFRIEAIERGFLYRDTGEGKDIYGLRETERKLPEGQPEGSRKALPEGAGNPQKTTGNSVPIYTYISGAATQAAAPDEEEIKTAFPAPARIMAADDDDDPAADFYDTDKRPRF